MLGICFYAVTPAHAGLIAYEGFDYNKGDSLKDKNGGTGWGNKWLSVTESSTIIDGSLADPTKTLMTTGRAVTTSSKEQAGGIRVLKNKLGQLDDKLYFLSFLLQSDPIGHFSARYGRVSDRFGMDFRRNPHWNDLRRCRAQDSARAILASSAQHRCPYSTKLWPAASASEATPKNRVEPALTFYFDC
jgi:hypothetical protein